MTTEPTEGRLAVTGPHGSRITPIPAVSVAECDRRIAAAVKAERDRCTVERAAVEAVVTAARENVNSAQCMDPSREEPNEDCAWAYCFNCEELWPCPGQRQIDAIAALDAAAGIESGEPA